MTRGEAELEIDQPAVDLEPHASRGVRLESDDVRGRARSEPLDDEIRAPDDEVRRDDRGCSWKQRVEELALRPCDPLDRADELQMRRADVRDHADVGSREGAQVSDLPEAAHRELEH